MTQPQEVGAAEVFRRSGTPALFGYLVTDRSLETNNGGKL